MVKPSVPEGVPRIMLGGGIGAGKSLVSELFSALGAAIIEADAVGHAVYEPGGAVYDEVAARWPPVVVDGEVNRPLLAAIVFSDPAELADLEALTHPAIVEAILKRAEEVQGPVVVEVPVMLSLDAGWRKVFVDASEHLRVERAIARGGDPADVRRRADAQASREAWLEWADFVIVNEGSVDGLQAQVAAVWDELVAG